MDLVSALDVSNYNDLASDLARFPGTRGVVVRAPLSVEPLALRRIALEQIELLRERNLLIAMYVWGYRDVDPIKTIQDVVDFCASINLVLPMLWLDLETYGDSPGPDFAWIKRFTDHCKALGIPTGLYTGRWWVEGYFAGSWSTFSHFNDLPVWVAQYDDVETLDVHPAWTREGFTVWGKQFSGTPIDRDVFLPDAFGLAQPTPAPAPGDLTPWINGVAYLGDDIGDQVTQVAMTLSRLNSPLESPVLSKLTVDLGRAAAELQRVRTDLVGPRP